MHFFWEVLKELGFLTAFRYWLEPKNWENWIKIYNQTKSDDLRLKAFDNLKFCSQKAPWIIWGIWRDVGLGDRCQLRKWIVAEIAKRDPDKLPCLVCSLGGIRNQQVVDDVLSEMQKQKDPDWLAIFAIAIGPELTQKSGYKLLGDVKNEAEIPQFFNLAIERSETCRFLKDRLWKVGKDKKSGKGVTIFSERWKPNEKLQALLEAMEEKISS